MEFYKIVFVRKYGGNDNSLVSYFDKDGYATLCDILRGFYKNTTQQPRGAALTYTDVFGQVVILPMNAFEYIAMDQLRGDELKAFNHRLSAFNTVKEGNILPFVKVGA